MLEPDINLELFKITPQVIFGWNNGEYAMQQRRLTAIMFSDIVGYTAMMGKDEDTGKLKAQTYRTLLEEKVAIHGGEVINHYGDGSLTTFQSSVEAVQCAKEIQLALKNHDIPLRIGIHLGDISIEDQDIYGDGVNLASRVESMGTAGGILITKRVYEDVKHHLEFVTVSLGEFSLKNVSDPVEIYAVGVEGLPLPTRQLLLKEKNVVQPKSADKPTFIQRNRNWIILLSVLVVAIVAITQINLNSSKEITDKSVAVLPFKNDSPDPDNEYFCNGMMEEISDKLHKIGEINVLARTATEQYRSTTKDFTEIAQELGVDNILTGSVRKYDNKFRIHVQLTQAGTGYNLWSDGFDGVLSDTIFTVISNIAEEIALKLNAVITPFERHQIVKSSTSNYAAYDKYMRGRQLLRRFWKFDDKKDREMAETLFRESLEIDPEFSSGYAGLCEIFQMTNLDSVNYYAEKVIEFDPNNGWGYAFKGVYLASKGELDHALESYDMAIEVHPNNYWFYEKKGTLLCYQKQDFRTGMPYLKSAKELLIKQRRSVHTLYAQLGALFLNIGDYEKVWQYFKASLDVEPRRCSGFVEMCWVMFIESGYGRAINFLDSIVVSMPHCTSRFNIWRFHAHVLDKEFDQAEEYLNSYLDHEGELNSIDSLHIAYMKQEQGNEEEALVIINRSQNSLKRENINGRWWRYLQLSINHALKEEREKSLQYLSKAVEIGLEFGWHDMIKKYPPFESFRDDPEFKVIVQNAQEKAAKLRAQVKEMEERGEMEL